MIKILHIIQALGNGGGPRALIATAKKSADCGKFSHRILSLLSVDKKAYELAVDASLPVLVSKDKDEIKREIENADIVHVHFWNTPEIYEFFKSDLPPMRMLIWFHIGGQSVPQIITEKLVNFADFALACSPFTYDHPVFMKLEPGEKLRKTSMVYGAADFDRLEGLDPKPHDSFNVGYVGTFSLIKMHRNFISMSASIDIPDIRIIVCGHLVDEVFVEEAQCSDAASRFDFMGFVPDIKNVYEMLDVFGYPLCDNTYAAAELTLQEAMFAGIPPVVFPAGGIKKLVINDFTGLVVNSEIEYKEAIEYLYHNRKERKRIGDNAQNYARQIFGAYNAAKKLNKIYEYMMKIPPRNRLWGEKPFLSLLDQPVTIQDLTGERYTKKMTGAEHFIESLGKTDEAAYLVTSMKSTDFLELLKCEEKIAVTPRVMFCNDTGGILQYEAYYPEDPYLRLWSGLKWKSQKEYSNALGDFSSAKALGMNHWRISWYISQAAEKVGQITLAKQYLQHVIDEMPDFKDAQEMLQRLGSHVDLPEKQEKFITMCPHCDEKVLVSQKGQWACPVCKNEFVV